MKKGGVQTRECWQPQEAENSQTNTSNEVGPQFYNPMDWTCPTIQQSQWTWKRLIPGIYGKECIWPTPWFWPLWNPDQSISWATLYLDFWPAGLWGNKWLSFECCLLLNLSWFVMAVIANGQCSMEKIQNIVKNRKYLNSLKDGRSNLYMILTILIIMCSYCQNVMQITLFMKLTIMRPKKIITAVLAGQLIWAKHCPVHQKVKCSIPSTKGNRSMFLTSMCLSVCLSLSPPHFLCLYNQWMTYLLVSI